MSRTQPTAVWTCDRCHIELRLDADEQPLQWTRMAFAHPPKAALGSDANYDLCGTCRDDLQRFLSESVIRGTDTR